MPFWLARSLDELACIVEVALGMAFSNQIRSMRFRDVLKLGVRVFRGNMRCMIGGK